MVSTATPDLPASSYSVMPRSRQSSWTLLFITSSTCPSYAFAVYSSCPIGRRRKERDAFEGGFEDTAPARCASRARGCALVGHAKPATGAAGRGRGNGLHGSRWVPHGACRTPRPSAWRGKRPAPGRKACSSVAPPDASRSVCPRWPSSPDHREEGSLASRERKSPPLSSPARMRVVPPAGRMPPELQHRTQRAVSSA